MNKGGFSWQRFLGVTAAKRRVSRATGIPWSRSGRNQKIGRIVTGGGCLIPVLLLALSSTLLVTLAFFLF
jgi:hypothetical protein